MYGSTQLTNVPVLAYNNDQDAPNNQVKSKKPKASDTGKKGPRKAKVEQVDSKAHFPNGKSHSKMNGVCYSASLPTVLYPCYHISDSAWQQIILHIFINVVKKIEAPHHNFQALFQVV